MKNLVNLAFIMGAILVLAACTSAQETWQGLNHVYQNTGRAATDLVKQGKFTREDLLLIRKLDASARLSLDAIEDQAFSTGGKLPDDELIIDFMNDIIEWKTLLKRKGE